MSTDLPPLVARDDGSVLISGAALPLLYRCVLAGIARQHRDGIATPPLLHHIRTTLYRAAMSPTRHPLAETPAVGACCESQNVSDLISVGEAAAILRVTPLRTNGIPEFVAAGLRATPDEFEPTEATTGCGAASACKHRRCR